MISGFFNLFISEYCSSAHCQNSGKFKISDLSGRNKKKIN